LTSKLPSIIKLNNVYIIILRCYAANIRQQDTQRSQLLHLLAAWPTPAS
jgi:hypothetical protein